jgi:L-ascorbate metabolism protein UlaG (beta-lactamase superfamily)
MIKLTWLGHSAFLIETETGNIVLDPFLSGNPVATVRPEAIQADYILVTHGHGDHLGDAIDIAKNNEATIIAPFELATYCQDQGAKAHPMHIGGAYQFPFGRVKLTPALHGSAAQSDKGLIYTGNPCGFLITVEDKTIYFAGDTGLFYDMKLMGEMEEIDLALLPIGGNFTMDAADALKAVEFLKPKLTIPMHYNTFDIIQADPEVFVRNCQQRGYKARALQINESIEV